jgi:hypothetical protein
MHNTEKSPKNTNTDTWITKFSYKIWSTWLIQTTQEIILLSKRKSTAIQWSIQEKVGSNGSLETSNLRTHLSLKGHNCLNNCNHKIEILPKCDISSTDWLLALWCLVWVSNQKTGPSSKSLIRPSRESRRIRYNCKQSHEITDIAQLIFVLSFFLKNFLKNKLFET